MAQAAQNKATSDRYRDEVLVAYIKEIGDLLRENNGSLTQTALTHTLARVKTLNTIRQLDGPRQIHAKHDLLFVSMMDQNLELLCRRDRVSLTITCWFY